MKCERNEILLESVITDIAAGPFGSRLKVSSFVQSGFPIIDGANLKGFKVTDNITKFVTEEKARSLSRSIAKRNDVVVTISGTLGQIAYVPWTSCYPEYLCSQRQFRVTFDGQKVCVPYLVYYFHTHEGQNKILSFANQTGVPALAQPLKNFRKIKVNLPDIETQKRIVSVLSALDDKIELNNKINANLERQGAEFVKQYRSVTDVDVPLSDIMSFDNGFPFQSETYLSSGRYRVITIKNVQDGYIDSKGAAFIDKVPLKMKPNCVLHVGDVLLSLTGNVGRVGIVCESGLLLNQRVAKIVPKKQELLPFLYFFYRQSDMKILLESIAKGTAQLNLSPVETLNLTVPYKEESAILLSRLLSRLFQKVVANTQENLTLSTLRDALLPRLMSGQIEL